MNYVQIRYVIACGFFGLGFSMVYAHGLSPQSDFTTLALVRGTQAACIGFLFAPISTLAYRTLPAHLNSDATSLFTMLRNIGGSVGISLATSLVISRSQVWQAYLVGYLSPLWQPYDETLRRVSDALASTGAAPGALPQDATGSIYLSLLAQSGILAYLDLFAVSAILCFAMVPVTFLFSPVKGGGAVSTA